MLYDKEELDGLYRSADDDSLFWFQGEYYVNHGRTYLYVVIHVINLDNTVSMLIVKVYSSIVELF